MAANWWQRGVIYQIYPRSFQDSNGDGVGDLGGISHRLDYLASLGVDAVWLSPIYPSPMADFGYDICDYANVDPTFGTLAAFDDLLGKLKRVGLKLILDFVPNHTSDRHPWFVDSRASRTSAKRDWYLWRDPSPDGGPPNNWLSHFGGSAWEWDPTTGQYYLHSFLKEQPDLNWRNPEVVHTMHEVLRFWLRRGVDGFRVDVLWLLIKDDQWRDNPPNPAYRPGMAPLHSQLPLYSSDRPEVQSVVAGLRRVLDEFEDRVLIGEIYLPIDRLVAYYGVDLDGVQMPFNFQLLGTPWAARTIAELIDRYEAALPVGGWPNWVLGNHDNPRIATRVGLAQARVAAVLLLTLRGTPTMYYGDEIGMRNVAVPANRIQDPYEKNVPRLGLGRDPCRTPMPWDGSCESGFTDGTPWLPLGEDHDCVNVEAQSKDPHAMLALYRCLLDLRKSRRALSSGGYRPIHATGNLLLYLRHIGTEEILVALNFGDAAVALDLNELDATGRPLLSTELDQNDRQQVQQLALRPNEGLIIELSRISAKSHDQ